MTGLDKALSLRSSLDTGGDGDDLFPILEMLTWETRKHDRLSESVMWNYEHSVIYESIQTLSRQGRDISISGGIMVPPPRRKEDWPE